MVTSADDPRVIAAYEELIAWIDTEQLSSFRLRNYTDYDDARELALSLIRAADAVSEES